MTISRNLCPTIVRTAAILVSMIGLSACSTTGSTDSTSDTTSDTSSISFAASEAGSTAAGTTLDGSTSTVTLVTSSLDETTGAFSGTVDIGGTNYVFTNAVTDADGFTVSDDGTLSVASGTDLGLTSTSNVEVFGYATGTGLGTDSSSVTDLGLAISGDLTPTSSLPASATYSGIYIGTNSSAAAAATNASQVASATGTFSATATFGTTNTLSGTFSGGLLDSASIAATGISDTFTATITSGSDTGTLSGGFYGSAAEDIAATGSGTFSGTSTLIGMIGSQ